MFHSLAITFPLILSSAAMLCSSPVLLVPKWLCELHWNLIFYFYAIKQWKVSFREFGNFNIFQWIIFWYPIKFVKKYWSMERRIFPTSWGISVSCRLEWTTRKGIEKSRWALAANRWEIIWSCTFRGDLHIFVNGQNSLNVLNAIGIGYFNNFKVRLRT